MALIVRLLSYLKQEVKLFVIGISLLLASTVAQTYSPIVLQEMIDQQLTPLTQGATLDVQQMWQRGAIYVGLYFISAVIGYIAVILLMKCANRVAEFLRNRAFDVMQRLPIAYFDDKPAGKIASRIVNDTETLRKQFYGGLLSQAILQVVQIAAIYGFLFYMNWIIGAALLLVLPFFYFWQTIYSKKTSDQMKVFYEAKSEINSQVNDTMNGSEMIQLTGNTAAFTREFDAVAERMYQADLQLVQIEATMAWSLSEMIKRLFIALVLAIIGYQYLGQRLSVSVGEIFLFINYIDRLFLHFGMLVRQFPQLQQSLTTGQRVLELLDAELESEQTAELVVTEGAVVFEAVGFGYLPEQPVLTDINIDAKPGETVALVGHTGSGKSSIINLLFRFYDPQTGHITIDDQVIQAFSRESVRKEMGIVLQDPYLFTGTIFSNITMDDATITEADAWQALERVGAKDFVERLPKGIHEPVFEKGSTYSSGERQLISFARTLAANPKILILDEATSHIDTETEEIIQHAMQVVAEGRTTFIIAHRLSTIQSANQILVLHEGEIVERGTHQSLLAQGGRYADMYRMQQKIGGND